MTLVQRFLAEGEAGLEPRSRRPNRSPPRIPDALENEIVAMREELDELGQDSGGQPIAFHLERPAANPLEDRPNGVCRKLGASGLPSAEPGRDR